MCEEDEDLFDMEEESVEEIDYIDYIFENKEKEEDLFVFL